MKPGIQKREGVVWVDGLAGLRYHSLEAGSVRMYRTVGMQIEILVEGKDFALDAGKGLLHSLEGSAVRDYRENCFYNVRHFDHTRYPGYGNDSFLWYADYRYDSVKNRTDEEVAAEAAMRTIPFDCPGKKLTYLVYGDSISTGAEASSPEYAYFSIFADALREKGSCEVVVQNAAVGGETSSGGADRFAEVLDSVNPDLVTIGYGMNDQNLRMDLEGTHFVEIADYSKNMAEMAERVLASGAVPILLSPCMPNPLWQHSSGDLFQYGAALKDVCEKLGICFADVTSVWQNALDNGKTPQSLLRNDINHPNDYGHRLYGITLAALLR